MSYDEYEDDDTEEVEVEASDLTGGELDDTPWLFRYTDERDPDKVHLADFEITSRRYNKLGEAEETKLRADCYRAAIGKDDVIYLLDVVGNHQTINAIRAGLNKSVKSEMHLAGAHQISRWTHLKKDDMHGYRIECEPLGPHNCALMHMVAVSNAPGFMPFVTAASLAKSLATDKFPTPILSPVLHGPGTPDWMPWLGQQLYDANTLQLMDSHNCRAGIIKQEPGAIEKIVSAGIKCGALKWVDYDMDEILQARSEMLPK